MQDKDISNELQAAVAAALENNRQLCIRGGGSKDFYGRQPVGEALDISQHRGIINYEPTELVVTLRAGTPLTELEQILSEHGQMLPFEPPCYSGEDTVGGVVACNLSGPRRAYDGAVRDFLLGCHVLNGKAEILTFGGEVMKNVAGYDASRLMAGAMGTLGVLLDVSFKVLPLPERELTVVHDGLQPQAALDKLHQWSQMPVPISASSYYQEQLHVRLSGTAGAVRAAHNRIGGERQDETAGKAYWQRLKNHRHGFFDRQQPLWRLSIASDAAPFAVEGNSCYEWGGALRWLSSDAPAAQIRRLAEAAGGHATLFRHATSRDDVFHPLPDNLAMLHRQLKQAFDPAGIFNRGRMYADL
jgi:glycolate oxidase FAD binding subunit